MWTVSKSGRNKPSLEWLDSAINGDEDCPECGIEKLEDCYSCETQESWLECGCGFQHVYEKA